MAQEGSVVVSLTKLFHFPADTHAPAYRREATEMHTLQVLHAGSQFALQASPATQQGGSGGSGGSAAHQLNPAQSQVNVSFLLI